MTRMAAMNHFGMTLRGWRERMSPQDSGLEADGERRISGLRREELARLAGISVDYVVRLEQGRAGNPRPKWSPPWPEHCVSTRPNATICSAAPTSRRPPPGTSPDTCP